MGRSHIYDATVISITTESPMDQVISLKSGKIDHACEAWYDSLQAARPLLVVISGPSGVGKDVTIRLMKEQAFPFYFVVTATTRPRRAGEVDGVDYHFVSEAAFKQMIADGELLEHALVYGQYKGIPKAGVRTALASGQDVIMRIDVQGAATVRRLVPHAISIFLTAESEAALVERLRRRHTEDEAQLQRRIETARAEVRRAVEFKYRVVNRECSLDATVNAVVAIMQAEKCRTDWQPVTL
jgi:guanylate kinase